MVESFNPLNVWSPIGAFSMGVVQGNGRIVGKGDMKHQVRQTLDNIEAVIAHVGGTMADIMSLPHYVTDIKQLMEAGAVRREIFAGPFPVTTTVEVSRHSPDRSI